ncbi:flagellar basal-body rod protein FlgG [Ectothiorhodospiraceae bacterium BW-2]|nr:flagellar basal-body rod protein FlgG [Ectothiorhodospiraceae bacterium BW-2]
MNPALWIAKTGVSAQSTKLGVVSNNLANVSTTGFKRDRANFEDLLYQNIRQPGAQSSATTTFPSGLMRGTGVQVVSTTKEHMQGNINPTDNALDMAINGRGFFQILQPDGTIGYTRNGSFSLNQEGQIVTANGYPLEPAINIPQTAQKISVSADGAVQYTLRDGTQETAGNIQLADFINPVGLQPVGENLFNETIASGAPVVAAGGQNGVGTIQGGALEASNVNVVTELVDMIETQRAYEMNSKSISTADQMLQYLNQNL